MLPRFGTHLLVGPIFRKIDDQMHALPRGIHLNDMANLLLKLRYKNIACREILVTHPTYVADKKPTLHELGEYRAEEYRWMTIRNDARRSKGVHQLRRDHHVSVTQP